MNITTRYMLIAASCIIVAGCVNKAPVQNHATLPDWVNERILQAQQEPVANPPLAIYRCAYNNQEVFYIPPRCCDIPSSVRDESGNVICSPDGGITGQGDGKCNDFTNENCTVVWQDPRN